MTHQCICSHGLLVLEEAGQPIDMNTIASKYYPDFADAKTYKDIFTQLMTQPPIVPSVNNIPATYAEGSECIVLDTSKITAPVDKPISRRNKKQKRIASRCETGPSRKSRAV